MTLTNIQATKDTDFPFYNPSYNLLKILFNNKLLLLWHLFAIIFIVPIRIIFFLISAIIIQLLTYPLTKNYKINPEKPDITKPKTLKNIVRIIIWQVCRFWTLTSFGLVDLKVIGKDKLDKDCRILVAGPHSGIYWDALLFYSFPEVSPISSTWLIDWPFFGRIYKSLECLFYDKDCKKFINDESFKTDYTTQIKNRLESNHWKSNKLLFFPEGTMSNGRALAKFQVGAFVHKKSVQPIRIEIDWPFMKEFSGVFPGCWLWISNSFVLSTLLTMCQPWFKVRFIVLDCYHPSEVEKNYPELFARNVQKVIAAGTLELSNHLICTDFIMRVTSRVTCSKSDF